MNSGSPQSETPRPFQSLTLTSARGVYLTDDNGHTLMDATAGFHQVPLGYGTVPIAPTALPVQIASCDLTLSGTTPASQAVTDALLDMGPSGLATVIYSSCASTMMDSVIRLIRVANRARNQPSKTVIISQIGSYHGSTLATIALGGNPSLHAQAIPLVPDFVHVPAPDGYKAGFEHGYDHRHPSATPNSYAQHCVDALADTIEEIGAARIAAFVAEPVNARSDGTIASRNYWQQVQALCRQHEIALVCDEAACGFGRLGTWLGCQYFDLTPDAIILGSGLTAGTVPASGAMINETLASVLESLPAAFFPNPPQICTPLAAKAALDTLTHYREYHVLRLLEKTIPVFANAVQSLADLDIVGHVDTIGLFGVITLVEQKEPRKFFANPAALATVITDLAFAQGVLLNTYEDRLLLSPALTISPDDIHTLVARIQATLTQKEQIIEAYRDSHT